MDRISFIASLTKGLKSVVDCGIDHGYTLIAAIRDYGVSFGYGIDVNKDPLEAARINIEKAGLTDKTKLILSDGLQDLEENTLKLKDLQGNYIWKESLRDGEPDTLCKLPVIESEYAPNDISTKKYVAAVFNPKAYWFAFWKGVEIQVLNDSKFALRNRVGVLAHTLADGAPADPNAFARLVMA